MSEYVENYQGDKIVSVRKNGDNVNIKQLIERLNEQDREIRSLKLAYGKCRDCKHANEYVPDYAYPYILPKCELGVKDIDYDSTACEDFQMIGRNSR